MGCVNLGRYSAMVYSLCRLFGYLLGSTVLGEGQTGTSLSLTIQLKPPGLAYGRAGGKQPRGGEDNYILCPVPWQSWRRPLQYGQFSCSFPVLPSHMPQTAICWLLSGFGATGRSKAVNIVIVRARVTARQRMVFQAFIGGFP